MAGFVGDDRIQRTGVGCSGTIFRKLIVARDGSDIFPGGTVEMGCCIELRQPKMSSLIVYVKNPVNMLFVSGTWQQH